MHIELKLTKKGNATSRGRVLPHKHCVPFILLPKQGNAASQGRELPHKHYVSFILLHYLCIIKTHMLIPCQRLLRKIHHDLDRYQTNFDDAQ